MNGKERKRFKSMLRIGKLRLYVTWNFRLKNSQARDNERHLYDVVPLKERLWRKQGHKCMMCGKEIRKYGHSQLHHVLPYQRFPQFATDIRNVMLLCNDCHDEIHGNPFLDCKMQTEKAEELGINLKDYYDV